MSLNLVNINLLGIKSGYNHDIKNGDRVDLTAQSLGKNMAVTMKVVIIIMVDIIIIRSFILESCKV